MAVTGPIRVLSVEDHPVFREGLSTIIGSQPDMLLVAQATNGVEAVEEFRRHRPDITLMDFRLPVTCRHFGSQAAKVDSQFQYSEPEIARNFTTSQP